MVPPCCDRAITALETFDLKSDKHDWQIGQADRAAALGSLVKAMVAVNATKPLSRLIDHTFTCNDKYDLTESHLATIVALESWLVRELHKPNPSILHWLTYCHQVLKSRTAEVSKKTNRLLSGKQAVV